MATLAELRGTARVRVPPDTRPCAAIARRSRGVPPRSRHAHADHRLGAAEPVRGVSRGGVQARARPASASGRGRSGRGSASSPERGYLIVAVHRGKNLLVTHEVAALLDPICRAEIERMRAADPTGTGCSTISLRPGPSNIADLQLELELKPKELKSIALAARALRRDRLALARSDGRRRHTPTRASSGAGIRSFRARVLDVHLHLHHAFGELLLAGVRAAVVAPERELQALVLVAVVLAGLDRRRARSRRTPEPCRRPRYGGRVIRPLEPRTFDAGGVVGADPRGVPRDDSDVSKAGCSRRRRSRRERGTQPGSRSSTVSSPARAEARLQVVLGRRLGVRGRRASVAPFAAAGIGARPLGACRASTSTSSRRAG